MGWKHYQKVDPPKQSPRLVKRPSINSSPQISIFQTHQIFNISYFPQFNLPFTKKNHLFPKMPKNHSKITQDRQTVVNEIGR